ncbi:hypothetical protein VNO77_23735 [Canavalia gladiata]|uniref:Uncharacterized protein n=1 Tax=Canavalia gladiata TaxID=3824 RepID=A0AAN9L4Y5_CANGL
MKILIFLLLWLQRFRYSTGQIRFEYVCGHSSPNTDRPETIIFVGTCNMDIAGIAFCTPKISFYTPGSSDFQQKQKPHPSENHMHNPAFGILKWENYWLRIVTFRCLAL